MGRVIVIEFVAVDGSCRIQMAERVSTAEDGPSATGPRPSIQARRAARHRRAAPRPPDLAALRPDLAVPRRLILDQDEHHSQTRRIANTLACVDEWQNSNLLQRDLVAEVAARKATQDLIVVGSASVAKTLIAHDLVDEFRLLVFPLVIGTGTRLFEDGTPVELQLISTEQTGAAARLVYQRARAA